MQESLNKMIHIGNDKYSYFQKELSNNDKVRERNNHNLQKIEEIGSKNNVRYRSNEPNYQEKKRDIKSRLDIYKNELLSNNNQTKERNNYGMSKLVLIIYRPTTSNKF